METQNKRVLKKELCPNCSKRVLDIFAEGHGKVIVELKCPHCKRIVTVHYNH